MSIEEVRSYINTIRRDFANKPFTEKMAESNPYKQYAIWFEEAVSSQILDPYAACLSTVDQDGQPSSRILYIRDVLSDGFVFYTNYNSSKGKELLVNNNGALNIFWGELERQIRIQGTISKVNDVMSDKYFQDRPRESQIGAWASAQSDFLKDREELESKIKFYEEKFKDQKVPRPPHWGGYCLTPSLMEFWQGRPSRLHDRIVYVKEKNTWSKNRLSP